MHRVCLYTTTALIVLPILLAPPGPLRAAESTEPETHRRMVHKVVIDCAEDSAEGCEDDVRVEVMSGDHEVTAGDHSMIWVGDGKHRRHISIHGGQHGAGGFLGVQLTDLTPELRTHFGVSEDDGVMISRVIDGSAAFQAGLQAGDIITGVDDASIGSTTDLVHAIRSREAGESVSLEVWRDGSYSRIEAALEQRDLPHTAHKAIFIDCEDTEADCEIGFTTHALHDLDLECPEGEDCRIEIECSDGECECISNGQDIDCPELHGVHRGN